MLSYPRTLGRCSLCLSNFEPPFSPKVDGFAGPQLFADDDVMALNKEYCVSNMIVAVMMVHLSCHKVEYS